MFRSTPQEKVKFNVNRINIMIIQSIALLVQLNKDINIVSMKMNKLIRHAGSVLQSKHIFDR